MRFRTKNVAYSTGLSQVRAVSYWLPCGADGRTDRHLTITSLPKFLGSIGNHFFLSTVLRGRGFAARSSDITDENNVYMALFKKGKGTLLILILLARFFNVLAISSRVLYLKFFYRNF